jgi:hypothetical protein
MSIINKNNIPDTLRTFELNHDKFSQAESIFVTPASFSFSIANFEDADYWYSQLGINIFPIHSISDFQPQDDPTAYNKSKQDFTYQTNAGKYRHKIKYDFSLDYHQIISEIKGDIRIIYASKNILRGTSTDGIMVRGFSVSTFQLEKILFGMLNSTGNSDILIELSNTDELNIYGYEKEMDWSPAQMDRLVLNISLTYNTDSITMRAKYLDQNISTITANDLTFTDDTNGNLTFTTFIPGDGIYVMSGFSAQPTTGTLCIQSTLYIGGKRYSFNVSIVVTSNQVWLDDNNRTWLNGDNRIFLN